MALERDMSPDDRYSEWIRIVERIRAEQTSHAWDFRLFRLMRAVFDANPGLAENGGFLFEWMADNYLDSSLMLLRRELDKQANVENLRTLLADMQQHASLLSRLRYRQRFLGDSGIDPAMANRMFDRHPLVKVPSNQDDDHIAPASIEEDFNRLATNWEHLRVFAERTRAHRTPAGNPPTHTIGELHKALGEVRTITKKYYALLTASSISWEPVPQFNVMKPFETPWVIDPQRVAELERSDGVEGDGSP